MKAVASELWNLIPGGRQVDPTKLATAIVMQIDSSDLDFRTRLLIRDSLDALASHWGPDRLAAWIDASGSREQIERIRNEELGEPGFPSLAWRVMDTTTPETILEFLRELGARVAGPVRIKIGDSTALIMPGLLSRMTDDIDVVDELRRPSAASTRCWTTSRSDTGSDWRTFSRITCRTDGTIGLVRSESSANWKRIWSTRTTCA